MKGNPTSCSRSKFMYEYVGRRDNWIGGEEALFTCRSPCECVRLIIHEKGFVTQQRNPSHNSIKKPV